ncbi:hypothetical protein CHU98_g4006 [Xylaria longipes]|nr:hypothetical protein CHU98_g4006 [Xylaria longipes]
MPSFVSGHVNELLRKVAFGNYTSRNDAWRCAPKHESRLLDEGRTTLPGLAIGNWMVISASAGSRQLSFGAHDSYLSYSHPHVMSAKVFCMTAAVETERSAVNTTVLDVDEYVLRIHGEDKGPFTASTEPTGCDVGKYRSNHGRDERCHYISSLIYRGVRSDLAGPAQSASMNAPTCIYSISRLTVASPFAKVWDSTIVSGIRTKSKGGRDEAQKPWLSFMVGMQIALRRLRPQRLSGPFILRDGKIVPNNGIPSAAKVESRSDRYPITTVAGGTADISDVSLMTCRRGHARARLRATHRQTSAQKQ